MVIGARGMAAQGSGAHTLEDLKPRKSSCSTSKTRVVYLVIHGPYLCSSGLWGSF